jgi:alpha-L-rhamnosidase
MFGDVSAWFYKTLAGINPDPASPGFKHFFIKPHVVGDLTSARAEYDSIRGRIVSDWEVEAGEFLLRVSIPANTTATVSLPIGDPAVIREGRRPAAESPGVTFLGVEDGRSIFAVESGNYRFHGPLSQQN